MKTKRNPAMIQKQTKTKTKKLTLVEVTTTILPTSEGLLILSASLETNETPKKKERQNPTTRIENKMTTKTKAKTLTPVEVTTTILPTSEGLTPASLSALLATSVASGSAHSANL